jgi:hypothetical protein
MEAASYIKAILHSVCWHCDQLLVSSDVQDDSDLQPYKLTTPQKHKIMFLRSNFKLVLESTQGMRRFQLVTMLASHFPTCFRCHKHKPWLREMENRIEFCWPPQIQNGYVSATHTGREWVYVTPEALFQRLQRIPNLIYEQMGLKPDLSHPSFAIQRGIMDPPFTVCPPMKVDKFDLRCDAMSKHLLDMLDLAQRIHQQTKHLTGDAQVDQKRIDRINKDKTR